MKKPILFVGNFLTSVVGTRSVGTELAARLSTKGWSILETSHYVNKPLRLADMVFSTMAYSKNYEVAYVDVYSKLAFSWAEVVTQLLTLLRKPMVLILRGGGLVEFAQEYPRRVARVLTRAQRVVTPSRFLQNGLIRYCANIEYLPNALEIRHYPFRIWKKPKPKLIWLRAFHHIYQPEMAVRVLALLKQDFNDVELTMAGPDKRDGSLQTTLQLAEKLGVSSSLHVVGPVPKAEVPVWLSQGDIFLNTTRYESFGVSVLEAALIGLPIVSTSVGELPYLWKNGASAMLVSENDSTAMARAVKRILTEPGLPVRLSQTARNQAEKFDWSVILPQWEKLFQDLFLDRKKQ